MEVSIRTITIYLGYFLSDIFVMYMYHTDIILQTMERGEEKTLVIGSSLAAQLEEKLQKQRNVEFMCKRGSKLSFTDYRKGLMHLRSCVTVVVLVFLGGNNLFAGKLISAVGETIKHYHARQESKESVDDGCNRVAMIYEQFLKDVYNFFPNLKKVKILPLLPRRSLNSRFGQSVRCEFCIDLTKTSYTKVLKLYKILNTTFANRTDIDLIPPAHLYEFLVRSMPEYHGLTNKTYRLLSKSYKFYDKVWSSCFSTDHIHLSDFGISLLSDFVFTFLN